MNVFEYILMVNRRTISRLNVAQLQLIQNDYLAQIESLNEELVSLLVARDDLVMEQDAMLTDIQDLSEFTNFKKWIKAHYIFTNKYFVFIKICINAYLKH